MPGPRRHPPARCRQPSGARLFRGAVAPTSWRSSSGVATARNADGESGPPSGARRPDPPPPPPGRPGPLCHHRYIPATMLATSANRWIRRIQRVTEPIIPVRSRRRLLNIAATVVAGLDVDLLALIGNLALPPACQRCNAKEVPTHRVTSDRVVGTSRHQPRHLDARPAGPQPAPELATVNDAAVRGPRPTVARAAEGDTYGSRLLSVVGVRGRRAPP